MSGPSTPSLSVTIVKALPNFTLNVSFTTDRQPLGLLGASGAGKSLILRCIAGTETPDSGKIVLNDRVLFDSAAGINLPSCDRRVGILFQNYALFPHLSVAENIAFGLPPHLSARSKQERVQRELAAVHLQGFGDRYPQQLSGGQQQRVALVRALASQPEALLLDEPFSALDTHLRFEIERDLRLRLETFPGVTLFITHNIEEAYRLCENLLIIDQGQMNRLGSKQDVLTHPQTVHTARLTGCKNISRLVPIASPTTHNTTPVEAIDWDCTLEIPHPLPEGTTHIGMRAHQIEFLETLSSVAHPIFDHPNSHNPIPDHSVQNRPLQNLPISRMPPRGPRIADLNLASAPLQEVYSATPGTTGFMVNTFPSWLAMVSETPHRVTLYLKLNRPSRKPEDYDLQVEVFREKWNILQTMPFPWSLHLDPDRLLLLKHGVCNLSADIPGFS